MERVFPNCAGLDIHKKLIVACRLTADGRGVRTEIRRFGTMTAELEALAAWLAAGGCTHVAMESTLAWRRGSGTAAKAAAKPPEVIARAAAGDRLHSMTRSFVLLVRFTHGHLRSGGSCPPPTSPAADQSPGAATAS